MSQASNRPEFRRAVALLVAGVCLCLAGSAGAATIVVSEDFSGPTVPAGWTTWPGSLSIIDDSAGLGSGNALSIFAASWSTNRTLFELPEMVELTDPGDWIEVSFNFRINGTLNAQRMTPMMGLYQIHGSVAGNRGYAVAASSAMPGIPLQGDLSDSEMPDVMKAGTIGRDGNTMSGILAGNDAENLLQFSALRMIDAGKNYTLKMRVTRTDAGHAVIAFGICGDTFFGYSAVDTYPNPVMSFRSFGMRVRNNNFVIDNFVVQASTGGDVLCNTPFADADGDTDVDLVDFAFFQRCYSPNQPIVQLSGYDCRCFDRTGNGHVDLTDLAAFMDCASGPGISAGPGCGK